MSACLPPPVPMGARTRGTAVASPQAGRARQTKSAAQPRYGPGPVRRCCGRPRGRADGGSWEEERAPMDRLQEIRERFATSDLQTAFMGATLERVAPEEVDVSMRVEPRHLNLSGTLHGGVIATLADTATGLAYRTGLAGGASALTSSLSATFLRPGGIGPVLARGRVVKRGSRFGYAEADVEDAEGRLLAKATATFTVLAARGADQ